MLAHERKQFILEKLYKHNAVKVSDLRQWLDASEVTIRRDLKLLEDEGLLRRTHGGAIQKGGAAFEPKISELARKNATEKMHIARKAYECIRDDDAIIIDSSSTGNLLASFIREGGKNNITVVTNSIKTTWELIDSAHVSVIVIGGQLRNNIYSTVGDIAENALGGLRVDKCFIGINGIEFSDGGGFTTPNMFEAQIKRKMIHASKQVYFLADSSKFNKSFLNIVCPLSSADYVITDGNVSSGVLKQAQEYDLEIIIAPEK